MSNMVGIHEFSILMLTFYRKSASKYRIRLIIIKKAHGYDDIDDPSGRMTPPPPTGVMVAVEVSIYSHRTELSHFGPNQAIVFRAT